MGCELWGNSMPQAGLFRAYGSAHVTAHPLPQRHMVARTKRGTCTKGIYLTRAIARTCIFDDILCSFIT
jgi:hypothetical protein